MSKTFNVLEVVTVWSKANIVPGYNPSEFRKDACGAWIQYGAYGNRNSTFGWEIDHVIAVINGGSDHLSNLQPLHWRNNASKRDGHLVCAIKSA